MKIEGQNGNRIQRIKRIQRVADIKPNLYYTKRGLTKDDQTGEISGRLTGTKKTTNLTAKEAFEMQNAGNQISKRYNSLNERQTEQDKVREFKKGYRAEQNNNVIIKNEKNEDIQKDEEER